MNFEAVRPQTKWRRVPSPYTDAEPCMISFGAYIEPVARDPLRAMVTVDLLDRWGGGYWLHVSVSRGRRLPTWGDLVRARDALGFKERIFVQLIPPASAWLNVHDHCLHLFHRLDEETVPRMLWDQEGATGERYGMHGGK